jgi:NAD(P)-dependent dehydrogenase (short-subunit alcohol dehydrogenase family)
MTPRHIVLVTGASRGLGASIARRLTRSGVDVVGLGRDAGAMAAAASGVSGPGTFRTVQIADLSRDALDRALDDVHRLDLCFVNAGVASRGTILESRTSDWTGVYETNVVGALHTMQAAASRMGSGATIVLIASTAAEAGIAGLGAYVASKHALLGLARTASIEFAERGIRVTTILPGSIATTILENEPSHSYMSADDAAEVIVSAVLATRRTAHLSSLHLEPWSAA